MSLIIAVPRERQPGERRVALDPTMCTRLQSRGLQLRMERDAGLAAGFPDTDYAPLEWCSGFADTVRGADVVLKVTVPTLEEIEWLDPGVVLLSIVAPMHHLESVSALLSRRVTTLAMDMMPRVARARPMDAISSQATVAGYKAALLAAELSPRLFPMLSTAAGTLRPARVVVIGAGVAGLQAIATCRRLGADVEAYDIRRAAREQIESLGARAIVTGVEAEHPDGRARGLKKSEIALQAEVISERLSRAHAVICAAAVPGQRAPRIVTRSMVESMKKDTVIVDIAAESGGNTELTRVGEQYEHAGVTIVGPLKLPSYGATHASEMYARNVTNLLAICLDDEGEQLSLDDAIVQGCMLTHDGRIFHARTAEWLGIDVDPSVVALPTSVESGVDDAAGWLESTDDDHDETPATSRSFESPDPSSPAAIEQRRAERMAGGRLKSTESVAASVDGSAIAERTVIASTDDSEATAPGAEAVGLESRVTDERDVASEPWTDPEELDSLEALQDLARLDGGGEQWSDSRADANPDASPGEPVHQDDDRIGVMPSDGHEQDDLTRIDGIGPVMQRRLQGFDIVGFIQLAELDDEQCTQLARQLELEEESAVGDSWRPQAQHFLSESS